MKPFKHLKHLLKILLLGICLGIFLGFLRSKLQIETGVFMGWYWTAAAVILLGLVLFNTVYINRYIKKMREAAALLEAGDPKAYVKAVEKLRGQARGRFLQSLFQINLSTGYCHLK